MVYVAVVVGLLVMLGIHELVVRVARRVIQRPWAVMLGVVGAYLVLVGFALTLFTMYGFSTGKYEFVVAEILPDSAAKTLVEVNDKILEVDHVAVGIPGPSVPERVQAAAGKPVVLTIERAGERREVTVQPTTKDSGTAAKWMLGVRLNNVDLRTIDSGSAVTTALKYPFVQIKLVAVGLYESFAGSEEIDIGGPKRIVEEFRALEKPMFQLVLMMLMIFGVYVWLALIVFDIVRMVGLARNSTARPR